MKLVRLEEEELLNIKRFSIDDEFAKTGFKNAGHICECKGFEEFPEYFWVCYRVNANNTVNVIIINDLGNGYSDLVYHDMYVEEVIDIAAEEYDSIQQEIEYIGETGALCGNLLYVKTIGNHLEEDHPGYSNCLKITCKDFAQANDLYCKNVRVKVKAYKTEVDPKDHFRHMNIEDCEIILISDEDLDNEIKAHKVVYDYE